VSKYGLQNIPEVNLRAGKQELRAGPEQRIQVEQQYALRDGHVNRVVEQENGRFPI